MGVKQLPVLLLQLGVPCLELRLLFCQFYVLLAFDFEFVLRIEQLLLEPLLSFCNVLVEFLQQSPRLLVFVLVEFCLTGLLFLGLTELLLHPMDPTAEHLVLLGQLQ
jgi:hypothetical protein